jgi:hypothetical protein
MSVTIPAKVTTTQNQWRFCPKCYVLFWNDDHNPESEHPKGICAGGHQEGEGHSAVGWDFYLLADPR